MDTRCDYKLWIVVADFRFHRVLNIAKMAEFTKAHLQNLFNRFRGRVRRSHGTLQETFIQIVRTRCFE